MIAVAAVLGGLLAVVLAFNAGRAFETADPAAAYFVYAIAAVIAVAAVLLAATSPRARRLKDTRPARNN